MTAPSPTPAAAACDIVLLEDDDLLRLTLSELLEEQGCRLYPAATVAEAQAEVERLGGACVLIADRGLGDAEQTSQDGHAVAADALARWPALRVIYISGAPNEADHPLSPREGRMLKPFDLGLMLQLIRELTSLPHS